MGDEDHAPRLPHEGQESAREAGASSLSEAGRGSWPEEDSEDGWDDIRVDATPGGHLGDMLPSTKRTIAAMLHSTASQRGIVAHRVAEPTSPPRPSSPRDLGGGDFQGRRSSEGSVSQLSDSFTRGSSGPGDPDGHGDMLQARRAGDGGEHGASHGGPSDATVMAVEVNFMGAGQTTKITVDPPPSRGELGRSGRRLIAPASSDTHGQPGPSSSTSSSVGLEERGTQRTNVNRKRFSFRRRIGAETHRKAAIFADNWDSDFKKNTMRMYSKNSRGPSRGEDGSAARTGSEADEDAVRVSQLKEGGLEEGTDKPHTGEEQSTLALFNRPFEAEALMLEAVDALEDLTARFAAIDKDPRWKINPNPLPLLPKVELPKREDKVHAKQIKRVEDAEIPAELAGQLDAWALPSPPNVEVMQVHAKALAKWVRARFEPHMREFVFAETNKREICGMAVSSFWAIHAVHFHRKSPAWHHARTNPVRGCFLAFVELYAFRILNFIERGRAPTVKDRLVEDALAECVANSTLEMFRHAFPQSSHRFKDPFNDVVTRQVTSWLAGHLPSGTHPVVDAQGHVTEAARLDQEKDASPHKRHPSTRRPSKHASVATSLRASRAHPSTSTAARDMTGAPKAASSTQEGEKIRPSVLGGPVQKVSVAIEGPERPPLGAVARDASVKVQRRGGQANVAASEASAIGLVRGGEVSLAERSGLTGGTMSKVVGSTGNIARPKMTLGSLLGEPMEVHHASSGDEPGPSEGEASTLASEAEEGGAHPGMALMREVVQRRRQRLREERERLKKEKKVEELRRKRAEEVNERGISKKNFHGAGLWAKRKWGIVLARSKENSLVDGTEALADPAGVEGPTGRMLPELRALKTGEEAGHKSSADGSVANPTARSRHASARSLGRDLANVTTEPQGPAAWGRAAPGSKTSLRGGLFAALAVARTHSGSGRLAGPGQSVEEEGPKKRASSVAFDVDDKSASEAEASEQRSRATKIAATFIGQFFGGGKQAEGTVLELDDEPSVRPGAMPEWLQDEAAHSKLFRHTHTSPAVAFLMNEHGAGDPERMVAAGLQRRTIGGTHWRSKAARKVEDPQMLARRALGGAAEEVDMVDLAMQVAEEAEARGRRQKVALKARMQELTELQAKNAAEAAEAQKLFEKARRSRRDAAALSASLGLRKGIKIKDIPLAGANAAKLGAVAAFDRLHDELGAGRGHRGIPMRTGEGPETAPTRRLDRYSLKGGPKRPTLLMRDCLQREVRDNEVTVGGPMGKLDRDTADVAAYTLAVMQREARQPTIKRGEGLITASAATSKQFRLIMSGFPDMG